MACNIIFRDYYSRYFFFSFLFSGCGARMGRVFFWYIFACSCFGLENIPRVDTHVRLIVRRAYRETCVTINDDGKVDCGGSATRGRDDHHISVRVLEMLRGDGNGEEKRVFFPSANGRKKKDRKKKRKDPSGWTAISSWFDIKGFGVVSFEGRDFSLGSELHGSFFFPYTFFLCSHSSGET